MMWFKISGHLRHLLLTGLLIVSRLVFLQRLCTPTIEKVDRNTFVAAPVGALAGTVKVRQKVHLGAIEGAFGEDTGDRDADVWLSV